MTANQKFMFDHNFDESIVEEIEEVVEPEQQPPEEPEIIEEIVPTFSEEELAAAKQEGFEAGKAEGLSEAESSIETKISGTLDKIADQLPQLFSLQEAANNKITQDATKLVSAVVRKIFPSINSRTGVEEVIRITEEVLGNLIGESRVTIRINDELAKETSERIAGHTEAQAFDGEILIVADKNIAIGDCQISWEDGSAERDAEKLLLTIDDVIERGVEAMELQAEQSHPEMPSPTDDEMGEAASADIPEENLPELTDSVATVVDAKPGEFQGPPDDQPGSSAGASELEIGVEPVDETPAPMAEDAETNGTPSELEIEHPNNQEIEARQEPQEPMSDEAVKEASEHAREPEDDSKEKLGDGNG